MVTFTPHAPPLPLTGWALGWNKTPSTSISRPSGVILYVTSRVSLGLSAGAAGSSATAVPPLVLSASLGSAALALLSGAAASSDSEGGDSGVAAGACPPHAQSSAHRPIGVRERRSKAEATKRGTRVSIPTTVLTTLADDD